MIRLHVHNKTMTGAQGVWWPPPQTHPLDIIDLAEKSLTQDLTVHTLSPYVIDVFEDLGLGSEVWVVETGRRLIDHELCTSSKREACTLGEIWSSEPPETWTDPDRYRGA